MKKILAIVLMLLISQFSFAEGGKNCDRTVKLTEKLDLQEDQVNAVQKVMEEQQEKRREMFQTSCDEMKEKMEGLHSETKNKLSSVLTAEQLTKFEELHAERMEKREKRREKFNKVSSSTDNAI